VQHQFALPGAVDGVKAPPVGLLEVDSEEGAVVEDARSREIALFRYALVRQAADADLSSAERGRLVRDLAGRDHAGVDGQRVRVGRSTLDRWIRGYRAGGFDALVPGDRSRALLTPVEILDLAVALKREAPRRTAAQICAIIAADRGDAPTARTIQRHFARLGLNRRPDGRAPRVFGRFEAGARNERWIGDALHGGVVAGAKSYLFAFVDDHSRLVTGHRWGRAEDSLRLEAALRRGLASRGVPKVIYVDNGSAFVSGQLARACAVLGIRLAHSRPGEPAGRGKVERFFRTVRDQFLVEIAARGVADLDQLNALFLAWVEQIYHRRVHRETGQAPLERFMAAGIPDVPAPALLREAFLWSATRTVTKTATVSLAANRYEVDPALVGRRIELVFDPFDLTDVEVRFNGQAMGHAAVHTVREHVHPQAAGHLAQPDDMPANPGIDYLALVAAEHRDATRHSINFAGLTAAAPDPGGPDDPPPPWPHEPSLPFPTAHGDGDGAQAVTR
jgi:putative transposase